MAFVADSFFTIDPKKEQNTNCHDSIARRMTDMSKEFWKFAARHESTILKDFLGAASLFVLLFAAMHFPL